MMDDRALVEHKLIIKQLDRTECAKIDPLGHCYTHDCLRCPNARVKITRQDGVVMRDDFVQNVNIEYEDNKSLSKSMIRREGVSLIESAYNVTGVELIEKMYDVKFAKIQRWILERVLKKGNVNEN